MAKKKIAKKKVRVPKQVPVVTLTDVLLRLDRIEELLKTQKKEEAQIEREEEKELSEVQRLEKLEAEIQKEVAPHPMRRITYHDITKGMIGAFVGIVGHFAFFYGHHIAETLSMQRATLLLVVSLALLVIFLYFSGFRRVKEYTKYLPIRVFTIFVTAMVVCIGVLFMFNILPWPTTWHDLYLNVAAVSILGVMGAATADLIGGE
jgi:uncharacterized membrane protein